MSQISQYIPFILKILDIKKMKILMKMRKLQLDGNEEYKRSGTKSGKGKSIEVRDPYLPKKKSSNENKKFRGVQYQLKKLNQL